MVTLLFFSWKYRDGSAVELIGLCKSTVRWLGELSDAKKFPYSGVSKMQDGKLPTRVYIPWMSFSSLIFSYIINTIIIIFVIAIITIVIIIIYSSSSSIYIIVNIIICHHHHYHYYANNVVIFFQVSQQPGHTRNGAQSYKATLNATSGSRTSLRPGERVKKHLWFTDVAYTKILIMPHIDTLIISWDRTFVSPWQW